MKLFNTIALVSSFVAAEHKKVPSRTPEKRLETLGDVYKDYVNNLILPFRRRRAMNQQFRINRIVFSIKTTLANSECAFFDPNIPNGGPRPDNNAKGGRKRREVDTEDPFDVYEQKYQDGDNSSSVQLSQDSAVALHQVLISKIDEVLKFSGEDPLSDIEFKKTG